MLTALEAAIGGFESVDILRYLKSALSPLSLEECDKLENYAILWNINGKKWTENWTMHPNGLQETWTQENLYEKTLSNMVEVKSRGAYLMGITSYGNYNIEDTANFSVYIPKTERYFTTSLAVLPLQLLGYYVSVAKGLDVDKPRNLAKSVTVE